MGRNILTLRDMPVAELNRLLDLAQSFRDGGAIPDFSTKIVCNLFFEPSTRTQYSFQVAEERLGMRVISFNPAGSSLNKNESFYDTVKTFDSFGVDALVIRHSKNRYYDELTERVNAALLNGGDGTGDHPTQSLLDLLTIRQEFGGFAGLRIAICGDIAHSRVAHTNFEVMERLGMEVVVSGPEEYMEAGRAFLPFDEAVATSDVLMMLRVQHERHVDEGGFSAEDYHAKYGMNAQRVSRMKKNAILMHPAPVNRGVEVADDVMECEKSRIFKQMQNGMFVRMAVLTRALEG